MALKHVFVALALFPSSAWADCESDAGKAREDVLASGPFHYTSRQWNVHFDRLEIGMIDPNRAEYIVEKTQKGQRDHERIYIDKQAWENDGFGWLPPLGAMWSHGLAVPDNPPPYGFYQAVKAACLGKVEIEGKSLTGYEVEAQIAQHRSLAPRTFIEKIYVDPDTGRTVRYERMGDIPDAINVVSTYRYDAAIKIVPPPIDLAGRVEKSLQAFQRAVDSADAGCRHEVIDTIDRGQTSRPFRYEMVGYFWSGVSGMHGTFVPPGSVHNTVDGVQRHGGGSETLVIGDHAWRRHSGEEWVQTANPSPLADAASASWAGTLFFPGYLDNVPNHIGGAACLGEVEKDHAGYRFYEYEVYRDFQNVRKQAAKRRMFVDAATGLPVLFEDLGHNGQTMRRETRTYDKDITLTPPSHVVLPAQNTPGPGRF
jgi:hypothetical protein